MAFFTDKFLNDRREELLRSVDRFQYQLNGGVWQTGTVNSKEIIGTNVVVFVNVPNFGQADTITGVRVYDINGALAGQRANKGVFITTSQYTVQAIEFAKSVERVVLVDGSRLTELMLDYEVGVSTRTVKIPKIDSDYFDDEST